MRTCAFAVAHAPLPCERLAGRDATVGLCSSDAFYQLRSVEGGTWNEKPRWRLLPVNALRLLDIQSSLAPEHTTIAVGHLATL